MHSNDEELIATDGGGSNIPDHPAGQYPGVCIDVIDRGIVRQEYKGEQSDVHKITLRFYCGETWTDENGDEQPLWVDKWFRLSMHEKAGLRKFVNQWRGVAVTEDEAKRFNVARLLHVPCFLQLSHNQTPNKTYVNVDSVMRLPRGMQAPPLPPSYVRVKDRPPKENGNGKPSGMDQLAQQQRKDARQQGQTPRWQDNESDLPF